MHFKTIYLSLHKEDNDSVFELCVEPSLNKQGINQIYNLVCMNLISITNDIHIPQVDKLIFCNETRLRKAPKQINFRQSYNMEGSRRQRKYYKFLWRTIKSSRDCE